jgi:hypothetical protein
MSIDPIAAYEAYSAAWNELGLEARARLLERCWSPSGVLVDPDSPDGCVGTNALSEYISSAHAQMPGLAVAETSEPQALGGRVRVSWVATQGAAAVYTGTDFVEFAEDGRIARVTMFYDSTPD